MYEGKRFRNIGELSSAYLCFTCNSILNETFDYYDLNRLTHATTGSITRVVEYDMVASLTEAGTTLDFTYDATQQRIKQSDGSNTILYLNDPVSGDSAEYHTDNGGQWHDYLTADGKRVGIRKEVISPSDITFQFFIQDNQGSIIAVLNEDGTMSQKLSYDAWGL